MINWTDAALEAALKSFHGGIEWPEDKPRMRAALDAAVQAHGDLVVPYDTFHATMAGVRADALEEAAGVAESGMLTCDIGGELTLDPFTASTIAAAIRALKDEKP